MTARKRKRFYIAIFPIVDWDITKSRKITIK